MYTTAVHELAHVLGFGTTQQDQMLTVNVTDPDGTGSITYQWMANGSNISGATSQTYTLTNNEVGKTLTVQAIYTDNDGTAENPISSPTTSIVMATPSTPSG